MTSPPKATRTRLAGPALLLVLLALCCTHLAPATGLARPAVPVRIIPGDPTEGEKRPFMSIAIDSLNFTPAPPPPGSDVGDGLRVTTDQVSLTEEIPTVRDWLGTLWEQAVAVGRRILRIERAPDN